MDVWRAILGGSGGKIRSNLVGSGRYMYVHVFDY